jgi:RNA polymerase sigma factor (TIGR02999 family)
MSDIHDILSQINSGDPGAADKLLPLVYKELRKLAAARLAREQPGQTLDATSLVHEAYLRLVHSETPRQWEDVRHFFVAAAEAMRRILIERARRRKSLKRGGNRHRVDMDLADVPGLPMPCDDILTLDEALGRLSAKDGRKAELVRLRFYAGLTVPQAAQVLDISVSTAEKDWAYARSWLRLEISDAQPA